MTEKLMMGTFTLSIPSTDTESDEDADFIQKPTKPEPELIPCPPSKHKETSTVAREGGGGHAQINEGEEVEEENVGGGGEVVCPLCWKKLSDKLGGMAHVKSCGKDLPTKRLIQALQLHEKQVKEWESIGIKYPGFQAAPTRGKGGVKAQGVSKQPAKRRKRNPPTDPELELAMALSVSLSEDVEERKMKELNFMAEIGLGDEIGDPLIPPEETHRGQRSCSENKPPSSMRIRFGKEPKKKLPKQLPTHTTTNPTGGLFTSNPKGRGKVDITKSRLYTLTVGEREALIGQRVSQVLEEILEETNQVQERHKFGHHQLPVGVSERLKAFIEKDAPLWTFGTREGCELTSTANDLELARLHEDETLTSEYLHTRDDDDGVNMGSNLMDLSPGGPKEPFEILLDDSSANLTDDGRDGDKSVEVIEIDDGERGWDCGVPSEFDQGFLMDSSMPAEDDEPEPPPPEPPRMSHAENASETQVWEGDSFFATIPVTDEVWRHEDEFCIPPTPCPITPATRPRRQRSWSRSRSASPDVIPRSPTPPPSPPFSLVTIPKKISKKGTTQKKAKIMLPKKLPQVGPTGAEDAAERRREVVRIPVTPARSLIGRATSQSPPRTPNHLSPAPGTPMLNYSIIDTPILKAELKRYGLKPFPRSKAKVLLRHIHRETHKK